MGTIKGKIIDITDIVQDLLDSGIEDYEIDEYLETQLTPEDFEFYHAHKDIVFDNLGYMFESKDENYIIPSIFEGCCPGRKRRPKPTIITRPTPKPPVKKLHEKFLEDSDPVEDLGIGTRKQISKWMKELDEREEDTDDNALVECARRGKTEWVKYLIARGANVYKWNYVALRLARINGHEDILKIIIDAVDWSFTHSEVLLPWAINNKLKELAEVIKDNIDKEKEKKAKRAKKIKESLNEKFVEDSDPVKDLGIAVDVQEETKKFFSLTRGMLGHINVVYSDDNKFTKPAEVVLRFFKLLASSINVQEAFYVACKSYNFHRDNAFCIKYRKYMAEKINQLHKLKIDPFHPNFNKEKEDI